MNETKQSKTLKTVVIIAIMIPIALLHFVTGSHYSGPFPLFVNGYLIDILLPFGLYFLLCLNDNVILNSWIVKGPEGNTVWDLERYKFFLRDTDFPSVHPSLQRVSRLNMKVGLFEVIPGFYQVRGFDLANITFIESDNGWVVFDPLTAPEPAAEAVRFLYKGDRETLHSEVGGGLDAANTAADHQRRPSHGRRSLLELFEVASARHAHADQRPRLGGHHQLLGGSRAGARRTAADRRFRASRFGVPSRTIRT